MTGRGPTGDRCEVVNDDRDVFFPWKVWYYRLPGDHYPHGDLVTVTLTKSGGERAARRFLSKERAGRHAQKVVVR